MVVFINQNPVEFDGHIAISSLLVHQDIKEKKGIAIAVNDQIVPKTNWEDTFLNDQDKVLIISATAGG